ncbi:MAG: RodZ domain-containing protein [Chloroflexales bacterium]
MSELGARLRQAREGHGISLAQAAIDTRILQQSLVTLEEGAYQRLPSDVVTRGFIRNYAHYLGLPPDELIELYRRERGSTDRIQVVPVTRPPRTRTYVLPNFFGVFFVTVALVGLAYVALNAVGRIGDRATTSMVAAPTLVVPPPSPLPTATPGAAPAIVLPGQTTPTSLPPAATPVTAVAFTTPVAAGGAMPIEPSATPSGVVPFGPSATPAAPIVLEVNVARNHGNENSWVQVKTDGNIAFEGIMRAGEKLLFQAQRRVFVRAGNPPDVLVTVNGLQQGALGQRSGQPVNWQWPPN